MRGRVQRLRVGEVDGWCHEQFGAVTGIDDRAVQHSDVEDRTVTVRVGQPGSVERVDERTLRTAVWVYVLSCSLFCEDSYSLFALALEVFGHVKVRMTSHAFLVSSLHTY